MLAGAVPPVVEVPQLGPLVLRVPLPELVAMGEHALLRPGLLLVASSPAEHGVEAVLGDRLEQGGRLQPVARRPRTLLDDAPGGDGVGNRRDDEADAELGDPPVAELERLGEVVAGVDVHHRKGKAGGTESLLGETEQHDRVLAAAEQQHRALEFGGHLAHHVHRLGLERAQVGQVVALTFGCWHPCGHD